MLNVFVRKKQKETFCFSGNRQHIRTDSEMLLVDKEEADVAFKKCKKDIMDRFLLDNGFCKYKTNAYIRLNGIGLLEYIDLQKEKYGSKTFCVNFAAMPLYLERKYVNTSLGGRLGTYISGKDVWWDYASEEIAKVSFANVVAAIDAYILPWFEEVSHESGYKEKLLMLQNKRLAEEWLNAIEDTKDKETMIKQSIEELGLPKRIQREIV